MEKSMFIRIRGARQHNLKNINIDLPKNKLIVFTGVSGSGKSSLAFDTIYAEGQRRYVESLSTYARQFLGVMEKPDVDLIEGLSPAISIDQKTVSKNPRSTVGTTTEIYDYLRLLFARIGHPHCPLCGKEIKSQSQDEILDSIIKLTENVISGKKIVRFLILSPLVIARKGEFSPLLDNLRAKGIKYARIDNYIKDLSYDFVLIKTNKHTIEAVIDKVSIEAKAFLKDKIYKENLKQKLSDSIEKALKLSDGLVIISEVLDKTFDFPEFPRSFQDHLFSEKFSCPVDNIQLAEIEPRTFSFNSPYGACPDCNGLGKVLKVDEELIFSPLLSIKEGGILPFSRIFRQDTWYSRLILKVCEENSINPNIPIAQLTENQRKILLYGTGNKVFKVSGTNRFGEFTFIYEPFPGIIFELQKRFNETKSEWLKFEIEKYMSEKNCPTCNGTRLRKEALSITIDGKSIAYVSSLTISKAKLWVEFLIGDKSPLSKREKEIAGPILKEISTRLNFLISVGLEYLTLDRSSHSLSGGEAQRIRLASQIGSGLTGVLYVLDEPTIGLHQKDNQKLINTLKKLRDLGNTIIVVEHDRQTIEEADFVVDFGPGAGKFGGFIVSKGNPQEIKKDSSSLTGLYLSGKKDVKIEREKKSSEKFLKIFGCSQYNLKNIDVFFPLGKFVVVTGVSGSGKSTLLVETLYPALKKYFDPSSHVSPGKFEKLEGTEFIDKVILIDQSPIGRTPRSNPATYTKVFDLIRDVFAQTKDAKILGFKKSRFSFNLKGGRCEACEGQGQVKIEMQFMNDIWINCEVCNGTRYNNRTLEVHFRGKTIAEVLKMSVTEAIEFFHGYNQIVRKLETLKEVGLGYIELGQPATTLSGGEAQRVKLSAELNKKDTGSTLYILDEPTTGLHFDDVQKLLNVLTKLVDKGNTVIVIEHNMDVIKNADWIIDLGPESGDAGGRIVAQGTPYELARNGASYTGFYLKKYIHK